MAVAALKTHVSPSLLVASQLHVQPGSVQCVRLHMPSPLFFLWAHLVWRAFLHRVWSLLDTRPGGPADPEASVRSVHDYWEGYKLFCYGYYSHSARHAAEFRETKLGEYIPTLVWSSRSLAVQCTYVSTFCMGSEGPLRHRCHAGQIVWRRHVRTLSPSPHSIRTTCMHLLPLVEMYCRWELQEDCNDLEALLERFESVQELESHELGRSLLCMVRDQEDGLRTYSERRHVEASHNLDADPFDAVRARLAAVDLAFQGLQPQVLIDIGDIQILEVPSKNGLIFGWDFGLCHACTVFGLGLGHFWHKFLIHHRLCGHFSHYLRTPLGSVSFRFLCVHGRCLPSFYYVVSGCRSTASGIVLVFVRVVLLSIAI